MLNIFSRNTRATREREAREREARWSARTPCPTCGARCMVATIFALDAADLHGAGIVVESASCAWCEVTS